ncbi:MAG: hypothetical protein HY287_14170 [Planctomycetes bacterium]|nr:hypothetical protein [Planctomycetota bacterium]MBI3835469.1 hypothetical protein [Planctomycetota bacterium]
MIQIRFHCPTDRCVAIIEYEPLEECGPTIECPRCHKPHAMNIGESVRKSGVIDQCAVCRGTEMFIRRDFPQRLGLAIVVVFGVAALYAFRTSVIIGWSILAAAVVLDLIIYAFIGTATTCYACRAEYRGCKPNPAHEGFDLATSEKYGSG